jgi:Protein of unknown function (DUF4232)
VIVRSRAIAACSCVALLVAACTSSSPAGPTSGPTRQPASAAPTTSTSAGSAAPTTTPTTATPTTATPVTTTPTSRSSAPSGPSACTDKQLTVGHTAPSGATGHSGIVVVFVNESTERCTLTGYPGAAVLDSSGKQLEQAKRTTRGFLGGCGCAPHPVVLRPGGKASALIEGDVGGGGECLRGRALLVTPPDTERSTRIAFRAYSCDVQVHPTVAGTGGGVPR